MRAMTGGFFVVAALVLGAGGVAAYRVTAGNSADEVRGASRNLPAGTAQALAAAERPSRGEPGGVDLGLPRFVEELSAQRRVGTVSLGSLRRGARGDAVSDEIHNFYFARAIYGGGGGRFGRRGSGWAVDWPKADIQFLTVLRRLTLVDAWLPPWEDPMSSTTVQLDDPELWRYPFLYALEVGSMRLSDAEVDGLRSYLLKGGFLMIDDFWGTFEWQVFEREIKRVLPDHAIVDIPLDHEVFSTFYQIDEIVQVPNVEQGIWHNLYGGPTHEDDGYVPRCLGIFDEDGRLMVVINWNTDIGDAWEWAEQADYPLRFSTFAYQMGANFIIYSMTR